MTYTIAMKLVAFLDIVFIIFLVLSGSIGGLIGEFVYYLAFIIPIAAGFSCSLVFKRKREEIAGVAEEPDRLLKFDFDTVGKLLPLAAPTVAVIFAVSLLTSLIMSALGASSPVVEKKDIVTMLIVNALTPAIFEEALFRYIPMKLLMPYSKRCCVFYSALCFALIHCSFHQMPYAFVAGVIFMTVDVALGSVWPSVILHFINNAASVAWMKYCDTSVGTIVFIGALVALSLVSSVFIFNSKSEYRALLNKALKKGETPTYSLSIIALALICGYFAVMNLYV